jgi:hypothetical protein
MSELRVEWNTPVLRRRNESLRPAILDLVTHFPVRLAPL